MQTWLSKIICKESVANGFSCDTTDEITFSYAGEPITWGKITTMLNKFMKKKCWNCRSSNWRVKTLFPLVYTPSSKITRY